MSVAVESFESILRLVSNFASRELPLVYSESHILVLKDMIQYMLNRSVLVSQTTLSLMEPIMHKVVKNELMIIISHPMLSYYIARPITCEAPTTKFTQKFNVVDKLDSIFDPDIKINHVDGSDSPSPCLEPDIDHFLAGEANIRMLTRLALLVQHWVTHYRNDIPFDDHSRFPYPEVADPDSIRSREEEYNRDW